MAVRNGTNEPTPANIRYRIELILADGNWKSQTSLIMAQLTLDQIHTTNALKVSKKESTESNSSMPDFSVSSLRI